MPKRPEGQHPTPGTNAWLTSAAKQAPDVPMDQLLARMMFHNKVRAEGMPPHVLYDDRNRLSTPCVRKQPWADPVASINALGRYHRPTKDENAKHKPAYTFFL